MPAAPKAQPDTLRSIYYALGANMAIAIVKVAGAAYTSSGALLAESLHSLADCGNEVLLLLGRTQANQPPSVRHPLGHGRATYFWSFIVALLLFSLGGLFSIYEGVQKWRDHPPLDAPWIAVAIVVVAMIFEGISLRVVLQQIAIVRGNLGLYRWFRETRRGELIVVLSEDIAAITGLGFALVALLATIATDNALYDAAGTILIGVLLMVVASRLGIEIKSLLIGESASPRARRAIRAFLDAQPDIRDIRDLMTLQQGEDIMVLVQAQMDEALTARRIVQSIVRCKLALKAHFPAVRWIFFEPVPGDEGEAEGAARTRQRRSRRRVETRAAS